MNNQGQQGQFQSYNNNQQNNNQNQGYNNNYPQGQQNPHDVVIVQQGGGGNCLNCKTGTMAPVKTCNCWTVLVAIFCFCGLCCDCAWGQGSHCLSCGYAI